MPGLFGFIRSEPALTTTNQALLGRMISDLRLGRQVLSRQFVGEWFACAQVGLDLAVDPMPPVRDVTGRYVAFFDGYCTNLDELPQEEVSENHRPRGCEQTIVNAFRHGHARVAERMNGIFVAVIYDSREHTLYLLNDRYGFRPVYLLEANGCYYFASEIKALLKIPGWSREVDRSAVCDLINYHFPMGDKTLFHGVKLLPAASIVTVHQGRAGLATYWEYPRETIERKQSFEDLVEEGSFLIKQAIRRQLALGRRVGVTLSGGLDSRTIYAFAAEERPGLPAYHFGDKASRETRIARQVAAAYGGPLTVFRRRESDFVSAITEGSWIGDGQYAVEQHVFLPFIKRIGPENCNWLLHGVGLDEWLYPYLQTEALLCQKLQEANKLYDLLHGYVKFQSNDYLLGVVTRDWQRAIEFHERDSFLEEAKALRPMDVNSFELYFYFNNRARRFVLGTPNVHRFYIESGYPFMDNDLVNFCLGVPLRYRVKRVLHREILWRTFPAIRHVPYAWNNLPLNQWESWITGYRKGMARYLYYLGRLSHGRLDWHSEPWSFDYRFRKERGFRDAVMGLLLHPGALSAGLYDPAGVKKLMELELSGKNLSSLFHSFLAIALFYIQFVCGDEAWRMTAGREDGEGALGGATAPECRKALEQPLAKV